MITLDGKPLLIEDAEVDLHSWMRRYQDLEDLRISGQFPVAIKSDRKGTRNGQKSGMGLPVPNYSSDRKLKINTLYWPTGAVRWGHGLYLADEATAVALPTLTKIPLVFGDPEHSTKSVDMWLLPPRPISANFDGTDKERLWLIPLVDDRFWWQFFDAGDFEVEKTTTWADVFQHIAGVTGASISVDSFNQAYLHPDPVELTRRYDNCALLLDAVAHSIGQRIIYREDGSVVSQNVTNAVAEYETRLNEPFQLQAGGSVLGVVAPHTCVVSFPKWSWGVPWCDGDLWRSTQTPGGSQITRPDATSKIVHSAAYADMTLVGAGGSPNNQSELVALASAISEDFYGWQNYSYDRTFIGLQPIVPVGFDDCVEWYFGQQLSDGSYRAHTRVNSQPHNFGVEQQLSQNWDWTVLDHFQIGKMYEAMVPQSAGGDGYADVKIWDTVAGAEVDTDFTVRAYDWLEIPFSTDDRVELHWHCEENAWYLLPTSKPMARIGFKMTGPRLRLRQSDGTRYGTATAIVEWIVGDVPVSLGDQVTVNFPGIRWAEAVKNCEGEADYFPRYTVPVTNDNPNGIVEEYIYVVTECQGLPLRIAFTTIEDRDPFTPDQDVKAVPLYSYGAAQDDLPISDWYTPSQQGGCGDIIVGCRVDPNNPLPPDPVTGGERGRWKILTACGTGCSNPNYEAFEGLPCLLSSQDITQPCYGEPIDPPPTPEFVVRFPQLTYPRSLEGADGHAILDNAAWSDDPADMRYVVVIANQQTTRVAGILPATNCGDDFSATGVDTLDFWPFSQTPRFPLTIGNTHKGFAGYYWKASWSEPEQKYVVWDMQKTTVNASLEIKATFDEQTNCTTIAGSLLEIDIETCKEPTPVTLLSYRSQLQKFVDELEFDSGQSGSGSGVQCDPVLRLKWIQLDVLTLCTGSTSGGDEITLTQETVVVDLNMDGCPTWATSVVMVFGTCGDDVQHAAVCEPCPEEGSGSGSGA